MNKQRYGIRQRVNEGNLNQLQDYAETGMEAVAADIVVGGGVVTGMDVTPAGGFTAAVASGRARDANGARASLLESVTMDLTTHRPSAGQETWVTLMADRTRTQSDPRVDPAGATYYFQLTESTQITVVAGEAAAVGAAARPARPDTGGVLVADVLLKGDAAAIDAADISTTRREVYTPVANLPASQITVTPGADAGYASGIDQVQDALDDVGARVKAHADAEDPHTQYALDSALNNYVAKAERGTNNGVASLDGTGKVPNSQLPASATGSYIPTSEKGTNSGVASLDGTGKLVQDAKTVGGKKPGAEAGDLPILNNAGKLPHSITGDAASLAGKTPGTAGGNIPVLDGGGKVPHSITGDAASVGGLGPSGLMQKRVFAAGTYDFNARGGGSFVEEVKNNASITFVNAPDGNNSGSLTQTEGSHGRWLQQLYYSQTGRLYFRRSFDNQGVTSWDAWQQIIGSWGGTFVGRVTAGSGGSAFAITAGSDDHTYMEFYARSGAGNVRSGYFGYTSAGRIHLDLVNQIDGGDLGLVTTGTGRVKVNGSTVLTEGSTMTAKLTSYALGFVTPAADRPLITKDFDKFTSGTLAGLGRWGVFMESARVGFGVPAGLSTDPKVIRYNTDSTIASEATIHTDENSFKGEYSVYLYNNPAGFSTTNISGVLMGGTYAIPWWYQAANWRRGRWFLEAYMRGTVDAIVDIRNQLGGISPLLYSGSTTGELTRLDVTSFLVDGYSYRPYLSINSSGTAYCYMARLIYVPN